MSNSKDERPFSELSRKERLDKARELIFGKHNNEYMGNIWGWKFSLFSFIGLLIIAIVAYFAIKSGRIDPYKEEPLFPHQTMEQLQKSKK